MKTPPKDLLTAIQGHVYRLYNKATATCMCARSGVLGVHGDRWSNQLHARATAKLTMGTGCDAGNSVCTALYQRNGYCVTQSCLYGWPGKMCLTALGVSW